MNKIIADGYDSDKFQYVDRYNSFISHLQTKPIKLFELGVLNGDSLRMWRDYFVNGTIIGLDRSPPVIEDSSRIVTYAGEQDDAVLLDKICDEHGPFDIIIDDCAHVAEFARRSFLKLIKKVKPGGFYVIEDWGTGYCSNWCDGAEYKGKQHLMGMVGFIKEIVDICGTGYTRELDKNLISGVYVFPGIVFVLRGPLM